MITIDDYKDAALKCQAVNRPNEMAFLLNAASMYMLDRENIQADKMSEKQEIRQMVADMLTNYSYDAPPLSSTTERISYNGETDFAKAVNGKKIHDVIELFDELMTAVSVHKRNLYNATLNRLEQFK